jgi:hypothetical protein
MAIYYGDYQSDSGKVFQRVKLSVYWVDSTVAIRGNRLSTTIEDDKTYLPQIWIDKIFPIEPKKAYCDVVGIRLRYALIWIDSNRYLYVELPFLPGSNDYYFFFTELAYKLKGSYKTLALEGESIEPAWLRIYARTA